jgi:hypothetical protein
MSRDNVIIAHKFICGKIVYKPPSSPEGTNENGVLVISQLRFFNRPLSQMAPQAPRHAVRDLIWNSIYLAPTINCWAIFMLSLRDKTCAKFFIAA